MKNMNWKSFIAGSVCTMLLFGMGIPAVAAVKGTLKQNQVNIIADGKIISNAGEDYALSGSTKVPSSVTFTTEGGGGTVYLPVRRLAELLGVDIAWDGSKNAVVVGENESENVPTPTPTPVVTTKMYARYPTVPDFGAFAGITESNIGNMIGSPGYYYDILSVDEAISRNPNLLLDYDKLLSDCGFSPIGSFEGDYGPIQCYSNGIYSIGIGIATSQYFSVLILSE